MNGSSRVYTVSEITGEIKSILESRFDLFWITGEVSNFSAPVSGHYYFTLKDDAAQIRSVMFRGQNRQLKFRPEDGMEVTGLGRIGVYEPRGTYQVIFEYLEPRGLGALQKAFEQLKEALAAEGLFNPEKKAGLPLLPKRIALVTSPTGAAVHDFLNIALRRFPGIGLDVVPVQVQGDHAAGEIEAALDRLDRWNLADVIVLARGGGSLEDLQPFNSEAVARAIFRNRIPVVSAVGHETDFTIADFTADLRAPTPSAAAELVVPDRSKLLQSSVDYRRRAALAVSHQIKKWKDSLRHFEKRLVHPRRRIDELRLKIDDLSGRILRAVRQDLSMRKERLAWMDGRIAHVDPAKRVAEYKQKLYETNNKIMYLNKNIVSIKKSQLRVQTARLSALNPMAVLGRGYSITRTAPGGRVLLDPASVSDGQRLRITLARGDLNAVADKRNR
ncbi:MAG: exodeoxyribonuclease VII large subunit [Desulfobacterales bacterium]|nr:exodeoxyribonuclease VII large subunit [Desulfobacterales bacterium]MCF8081105.1 exodeoxyribonuclease VII large subunit [Desulfobacterales bacterium]